jgi:NAD(P)H-dependent FMN reductase
VIAIRLVGLSGSLRARSINTALLRQIASHAPDGISVELVPLSELPLFNPDLEAELPEAAATFRATITASDGLIVASPEYAHGVSGVLKNALDWLVGCEGFAGKPVLVLNAAPRAHHAIAALRETLSTMAARLVENTSLVAAVIHSREEGISHVTSA